MDFFNLTTQLIQENELIEKKKGKDGALWCLYRCKIGYLRGDIRWFTKTMFMAKCLDFERYDITPAQWDEI